ncbi:MAG: histidine phosphatase family protein [Anaerolineae bacterium]|nr:histidine phosphatase family protein [Anaerolineae bacterium]
MQPYLILVRHSAVHPDPALPSHEWGLTEDGRSRCRTLAAKLQPYAVDQFITSHEPKAIETGQIMADVFGVPCRSAAGLQEHDRRGVPFFASKGEFETAVTTFFTHPTELVFGAETAVQARERFGTAVTQQLATHPPKNLAIVTHGTVLTLFICQHNPQLDPMPFWRALTLPCAFVLSLPGYQLQQAFMGLQDFVGSGVKRET